MKSSKSTFLLTTAFTALIALSAYAGSGPATSTLPNLGSIQGGVSVESAERQLQANLLDYQNDEVKASSARTSSCRDVKVIRFIYKNGLVPSPAIRLPAMPKASQSGDFSAEQVESFISQGFSGVSLNAAEENQLQALKNRSISSSLDAIQILITAQEFAISVSDRIYSDSIETYTLRADVAESYAKLDGAEDECNENTLRVTRDQAMTQATQVVLDLYKSYQAASQAALTQAVNSPN